jgi:hypothetical protein
MFLHTAQTYMKFSNHSGNLLINMYAYTVRYMHIHSNKCKYDLIDLSIFCVRIFMHLGQYLHVLHVFACILGTQNVSCIDTCKYIQNMQIGIKYVQKYIQLCTNTYQIRTQFFRVRKLEVHITFWMFSGSRCMYMYILAHIFEVYIQNACIYVPGWYYYVLYVYLCTYTYQLLVLV